jgi:chaperonin cofactor prefoldin
LNTLKFNITTNGELMVENKQINGSTVNFKGSQDDLIEYLNHRVEAMEKHIKFLESECNALYNQLPIT